MLDDWARMAVSSRAPGGHLIQMDVQADLLVAVHSVARTRTLLRFATILATPTGTLSWRWSAIAGGIIVQGLEVERGNPGDET